MRFTFLITIALTCYLSNANAQNIQKWLTQADEYIETQQYQDALTLLERAERKDEGVADLFYKKAICYYYLNNDQKSIEAIYKAIRLRPDEALFHAFKAKLWFAEGDTIKGNEAINKALFLDANCVEAYLFRADFYIDQNEFNLAITDLNQLYTFVKNDDGLYYRLAFCYQSILNYNKAIFYYRKVVSMNKLDEQSYWNMALCYQAKLEYDSCLIILNDLIGFVPNNPDYQLQKAICLEKLNRITEALILYNKLAIQFPKDADILVNMAFAYQRIFEYDNAITVYDKLLTANLNSSWLYLQKAKCYFLAQKDNEGEKAIGLAIKYRNPMDSSLNAMIFSVAAFNAFFNKNNKEVKSLYEQSIDYQKGVFNNAINAIALENKTEFKELDLDMFIQNNDAIKCYSYFVKGLIEWQNDEKIEAFAWWQKAGNLQQVELIEHFYSEWFRIKLKVN